MNDEVDDGTDDSDSSLDAMAWYQRSGDVDDENSSLDSRGGGGSGGSIESSTSSSSSSNVSPLLPSLDDLEPSQIFYVEPIEPAEPEQIQLPSLDDLQSSTFSNGQNTELDEWEDVDDEDADDENFEDDDADDEDADDDDADDKDGPAVALRDSNSSSLNQVLFYDDNDDNHQVPWQEIARTTNSLPHRSEGAVAGSDESRSNDSLEVSLAEVNIMNKAALQPLRSLKTMLTAKNDAVDGNDASQISELSEISVAQAKLNFSTVTAAVLQSEYEVPILGMSVGVVDNIESLSNDSTEASAVPTELHVNSVRITQLCLTLSSETGPAIKAALNPTSINQHLNDKQSGSHQKIKSMLGSATMRSKGSDEKEKKKRSKGSDDKRRSKRASKRKRADRFVTDYDSSTSASSEDVPSRKPKRTLGAFDATLKTSGDSQSNYTTSGVTRLEFTPTSRTDETILYGRDNEMSLLQEAYRRISLPGALSEIVLVHGPFGSGKSTLINHMEKSLMNNNSNSVFAVGKFDEINAAARPYSAIVDAVSRLCRKITNGSRTEIVKRNIMQALGSETKVLAELIPAIAQLVGEPIIDDSIVNTGTEYAFTRFKELFRSFMKAVSSPEQPVVIFFDDLQWADNASCALIESLTTDAESKHILFVWAYRDSDSGDPPPRLVTHVKQESPLRLSEIPIGAINSQTLKQMIADHAQLSCEEVQPLSDLIARRTGGNIHFVIQFLHMLQQQGLLVFSDDLQTWDWNIKQIESKTNVTDNVADLLTAKIARQPKDVLSIIQLAACLGFSFDVQLLEAVARGEGLLGEEQPSTTLLAYSNSHTKFKELLQVAINECLVTQTHDPTKFKFAHDRLRHCVYDMIRNTKKRDELHLRIGMLIWKQHASKKMDDMSLFICVDQLSRGARYITDEDTRVGVAQLNLEAASKAVQKSAYTLAAEFLEKGIALLNSRTMWQMQTYDLSLELHTKSAEMESILGNFDSSDSRVSAVLDHARTLDEKFRAYYVKLDSLGIRRRMDEAVTLGLDVLRQIGERISQRPSMFSVIVELTKTRRVLKGRKGYELLTLREMVDERKVAAMRLLNSIAFFAWHSDRNDIVSFVFLRMTRITLTHGVCKFSPFAFATFGMMLAYSGDIQQACDFGALALQLLEKAPTRDCHCSTQLIVFGFLDHLKAPLSGTMHNLMETYRVGMENGQVQYACQCLGAIGGLNIVMGMPLRSVVADVQRHRRVLQDYNQDLADVLVAPWHQFALNMIGQVDDLSVLTGQAMDEARFMSESTATMAKVNLHFIRMVLLYIIGDFEGASADLAILERRQPDTEGTNYMCYFKMMFSGLVCLAMARKTRRRKYHTASRKFINQMTKFGGGLNRSPMLMLMLAVQKINERGNSVAEVELAFEKAIVECSRNRLIYMEAIANERVGEYMISRQNENKAQSYLNRARQLYSEWDAQTKVKLLESNYTKLRLDTTPLAASSPIVEIEGQ